MFSETPDAALMPGYRPAMKTGGLAVAAAIVIALSACGAGESEPSSESSPSTSTTPTPVVEKDARYGTVEALKDAAIEAGYECKNWKQDDKVTLAAESGHCSGADVFATYVSEADLQSQLETFRSFGELFEEEGVEKDPVLFGPNWSINGARAVELQPILGGTIER